MKNLALQLGLLVAVAVAHSTSAHAQATTVGLFAPSAPFDSASERVDLASKLATHLAAQLELEEAVGRAYGRTSDFLLAVRKGEVALAIVDAPLASALTAGTVIAVSRASTWHLVAGENTSISGLRGKRLLVPNVGGRESEFALHALFASELSRNHFAHIEVSPDTASALAAVNLGRADAAVVPEGASLPDGVSRVMTLVQVPGPVVMVFNPRLAANPRLVAALTSFRAESALGSFRAGDETAIKALARSMLPIVRRGPMVVPGVRMIVGELIRERAASIEPAPPASFALPVSPPR
jgi:hypothetical protein